MKIHEYQAKAILSQYNVPVPRGEVAFTVEEAEIVALANHCRLANVRDRLKRILDSFKPPEGSGTA